MRSFLKWLVNWVLSIAIILLGGGLYFIFKESFALSLGIGISTVVLAFFRKQLFGSIKSAGLGKGVLFGALLVFSIIVLFASFLFEAPFSWGVAGLALGLVISALLVLRLKDMWVLLIVLVVVNAITILTSYGLGQRYVSLFGLPDVLGGVNSAVQTFSEVVGGPTQTPVATSTRMPTVEPDSWYYMACQRRVSNRVGAVVYNIETREPIVGMLVPFDATVNSIGYFDNGGVLQYIKISYVLDGVKLEAYISPADLSTDPATVQCQQ